MNITSQQHAEQMIQIAQFALGKIQYFQITKEERDVLKAADELLNKLRRSVTESDDATLKIRAA